MVGSRHVQRQVRRRLWAIADGYTDGWTDDEIDEMGGDLYLQYEDGEWNEINQTEDGLEQF